jgi:hypothetical protein
MTTLVAAQLWLQGVLQCTNAQQWQVLIQQQGVGAQLMLEANEGRHWSDGLEVYTRGYWSRLLECLHSDFPLLERLMGAETFELFGRAYLQNQPPVHYSLYQLSTGFADFLQQTCPPGAEIELQLPAALAQVERARAECWRAQGPELMWQQTRHQLDSLFYTDLQLQFIRPASVKLCELSLDLLPLLRQLQQQQDWTLPEEKAVVLWLARQDYKLQMGYADHWLQTLLQLCSSAVTLDTLALSLSQATGTTVPQQKARLMIQLPQLFSQGLISPAAEL